jgi:hypothetical protein
MAVAKGADIPKARLLDAVEATAIAIDAFNVWAHVPASATHMLSLPAVDAMQIHLAAWQYDRFGGVPTSDVHMALGVIEELGEAFDEDAGPEDSVDALGDVMVYASQLCTANRLAVRPVIDLACLYVKTNRCYAQPITIAGMLAHVALKHAQNIRGLGPDGAYRPRLVDALAMMIAKAIEDCTMGHELNVDPAGVFIAIGNEVMARKQGDTMIPSVGPTSPALSAEGQMTYDRLRADALEKLHGGAKALETPEAKAEGDIIAPTFVRLVSIERTEQCPVFDETRQLWCESDAQLAERINKQHVDLSA